MTAFSFRCLWMPQIPFYYIQLSIDMTSKSREQYTGINTEDLSNAIVLTLVGVKRHKQQLGNDWVFLIFTRQTVSAHLKRVGDI